MSPHEPIVTFFDGSKSDDSTALVGCRLSDGYCFLIGVWAEAEGRQGARTGSPPAEPWTAGVQTMFKRFNIVAFWGDPSHAKDQRARRTTRRTGCRTLDKWMREYKDTRTVHRPPGLDPKHWPVKSGLRKHAINCDMTSADRTKVFIDAAEQTVEDFETLNDIEEFAPTFEIDGHPALVQHLKNAIKHYHPRGWGTSLTKEQKDSPRKIDAAVCLVGARMLRRIVLNLHEEEEVEKPGEIWY